MADKDKKELNLHEAMSKLTKGLKERVEKVSDQFLELRKKELKKHAVGVCVMCGELDMPQHCTCLRKAQKVNKIETMNPMNTPPTGMGNSMTGMAMSEEAMEKCGEMNPGHKWMKCSLMKGHQGNCEHDISKNMEEMSKEHIGFNKGMAAKAAAKKSEEEMEKVAPPGREKQVKELKGKVKNPWAVAWASYDKAHKSELEDQGKMAANPEDKAHSVSHPTPRGGSGAMINKAEDYINLKNPNDQDKRIITQGDASEGQVALTFGKKPNDVNADEPKASGDSKTVVVVIKSEENKKSPAKKKVPKGAQGTTMSINEGREESDSVLPADKPSKEMQKDQLPMQMKKKKAIALPGMTPAKENARSLVGDLVAGSKKAGPKPPPLPKAPSESVASVKALTKPVLGKAEIPGVSGIFPKANNIRGGIPKEKAPRTVFTPEHLAAAKAKIGLPGQALVNQKLSSSKQIKPGSTISMRSVFPAGAGSKSPAGTSVGSQLPSKNSLPTPSLGAAPKAPKKV